MSKKDEGRRMKDENKELVDLKTRTKKFSLRIIKLYSNLPKDTTSRVIGRQLLRSGTSVGAHYKESVRAKSNADFINKIQGGLQELEETQYWLELLTEAEILPEVRLKPLYEGSEELLSILITVVKNVKEKAN